MKTFVIPQVLHKFVLFTHCVELLLNWTDLAYLQSPVHVSAHCPYIIPSSALVHPRKSKPRIEQSSYGHIYLHFYNSQVKSCLLNSCFFFFLVGRERILYSFLFFLIYIYQFAKEKKNLFELIKLEHFLLGFFIFSQ